MDRRDVLLAAGAAALPSAPALRVALPATWGPPFVMADGGPGPAGILPDLMHLLGLEMGVPVEWVRLPAMRAVTAMEAGEVDLQCPMHPDWWGSPVSAGRWSAPILTLRDVLVAAPDGPTHWPVKPVPSHPWRVGTVHGYLYPALKSEFVSGRMIRDDAPDQAAVLAKLARSRVPVGVVNEYALHAFNRERARHEGLRLLRVVSEVETRCLLAPQPRHEPRLILEALDRLRQSGRLKAVLDKYRRS
ncbi:substrate-binding periplasmic protein [Inhella gelatinilytica]|uniref:Transporter substrate-binding domain-containing protein n=1 Tax=Inhella gelatinilytica TaxID=2795030 RepID=A0A931IRR2_9BURK|nr:transporter substrate-binding domain-containing protein [Inhella gelatinilytica]MBH9551467.1 transporter substrate-binding domain-containing protein [Inhella gelatinilytica]